MATEASRVSVLLDSLPAVFQEDRKAGAPNFLGRFLLGFEEILLGRAGSAEPGLEETIARIYRYFEPGPGLADGERAPEDFLHWLAGWVALTLREDWDHERRRRLIAQAVPLYRMRGTRRGVEEMLRIYTTPLGADEPVGASIDELDAFRIGVHSTVGVDTVIGGGAPFFFRARVSLPRVDPTQARAREAIARAILDLQKPAHTYYWLIVETPTFQIGVHSTVGVDTLVG